MVLTSFTLQDLQQKIDYSVPVSGKHLDHKTYDLKFKVWDKVIEQKLLDNNDESALSLLNDTTLFAYNFLKDDDGQPFKLTAYQDAISSRRHDGSQLGDERFILFRSANQSGKSRLLATLAIQHAFFENNINIIIVSKSLPQSQFVLATIRHMLNNSLFGDTWRESLGETANTTILTFQRNEGKILNRIICAPCGEGLLGYPVHYLYLDEADFYENAKNFFWKVALPRTNKTNGQIILFSNPNPDISRNSSCLWELWHGKLFKRKFWFRFLDSPWGSQEMYDRIKKNSSSFEWVSTLDGEFPQDTGGFFTHTEIQRMMQKEWDNVMPLVDRPVYLGLDLAKVKDNSVLSLGVLKENKDDKKMSDLDVKYLKRYPIKTDYDVIISDVKRIIDFYKTHHHGVAAVGLDVSGVGKAVADFARAIGIKVTDVKFSLENKSRMYGNFKMLAEQDRIKIVYDEDCENQLGSLVFKRTPSGYLSVHHEKEMLHDDYPDSICALIDVSVVPSRVPISLTLVNKPVPQDENIKEPDYHTTQDDIDNFVSKQVKKNRPSIYGSVNGYSEIDSFRRSM
jgi:hypothetical protein